MPAKPLWYSKINDIVRELRSLPHPFVDRATLERLLGVGRRRAQQILAPCITEHIGANGLADRDRLIAHLERLAQSDDGYYENARRRKFAQVLERLRQERLASPQVLIEAPAHIVHQEMEHLPAGIHLAPGTLRIEFEEPQQALEKLLALAMAIGNDLDRFERLTRRAKS